MNKNHDLSSSRKNVNGKQVSTKVLEITNANILQVEVGTTGYRGGDTGHGGRTYFAIRDLAATDLEADVKKDVYGTVSAVEIELGGDTELETFIEGLEFAVKVLKEQSGK
ncbi:hypothetical protein [Candidatus Enterococcus clewellii]|uniref:Uncharacterized protein n=1 Tax=Candidatus Enterococcus clewellii TaxID=1834193 RepID=A0A242KD52_9ENTE|nr:hypothetical protein [Enterococcus sp. 9E7_DIV0242]OTP19082.1 hypothetical protein A5888_000896 [Enterococcus sp. 9E7_DIV0242]